VPRRVNIEIPERALVVLIGATGSGKSSFARKHFLPTEVVSSDHCRALIADDENVLDANDDAFALLHTIAAMRLKRGRLTVVDATNVQPEWRRPLVRIAREHDCLPVAIVLDTPQRVCEERNAARRDRGFGPQVVRRHVYALHQSLGGLEREGFQHVYVLHDAEEVDEATVERMRPRP
jgi:protein phosphatase